jgi:hypothetical protein
MSASKPSRPGRRRRRAVQPGADWTEVEYQRWFEKGPCLTRQEKLLKLRIEKSFESVVDILALDSEARIVLIEVKNERTTRAAMGQALEYLSTYDGVTLEELADELNAGDPGRLARNFGEQFPGSPPLTALSDARRVYLAAPDFAPNSDICARYLNSAFAERRVEFGLLAIARDPTDAQQFLPEVRPLRELVSARHHRRFVQSVHETLYFRLDPARPPIYWRIGKRDERGRLELLSSRRPVGLVVQKNSKRIQIAESEEPMDVDCRRTGATFRGKKRTARLLGIIGSEVDRSAVIAVVRGGKFEKYAVIPMAEFDLAWIEEPGIVMPGWRDLLAGTCR